MSTDNNLRISPLMAIEIASAKILLRLLANGSFSEEEDLFGDATDDKDFARKAVTGAVVVLTSAGMVNTKSPSETHYITQKGFKYLFENGKVVKNREVFHAHDGAEILKPEFNRVMVYIQNLAELNDSFLRQQIEHQQVGALIASFS